MEHSPEIVSLDPQPTAVVRDTVRMDQLTDFYDSAFGSVVHALTAQGAPPRDAFGLYLSQPAETVDLEVGFVTDREVDAVEGVVPSTLPGGEVARMTHLGSYDSLGQSWGQLVAWVGEQGRRPAGPMWEVYVTEPSPDADPATMRTDLFCLLG